jgi:hypothetical protein
MNITKFKQKRIGVILAIVFLAGCGTPALTSTLPPTILSSTPSQPQPGFPPVQSQPGQPPQPVHPTGQTSLLNHIKTVQVTPNEHFLMGQGSDILYIPATDRIVVMVQSKVDQPINTPENEVCSNKVVGYVEYTTDMQPTGKYGYLACGFADNNSLINGNDVFTARMSVPKAIGDPTTSPRYWTVEKYDAVTWERLASVDVQVFYPDEGDGGPDPSFINGQFVVTSGYTHGQECCGTHNNRFTTDLVPLETIYLLPPGAPSHYGEYSLLQQSNGDILLFASTGASAGSKGNLEILRFNKDWRFLDQKVLIQNSYYPDGSATDGRYVYVAYLAWSHADSLTGDNVHLAAFDEKWNLIQDVPVTDVINMVGSLGSSDGPSIALAGNRLFLSYVVVNNDPNVSVLGELKMNTYVDVFELTQP